jgi:hypothetical protein
MLAGKAVEIVRIARRVERVVKRALFLGRFKDGDDVSLYIDASSGGLCPPTASAGRLVGTSAALARAATDLKPMKTPPERFRPTEQVLAPAAFAPAEEGTLLHTNA